MKIEIEKPYLIKNDATTKLCCNIVTAEKTIQLWHEVNNEFSEYFCDEVCDSFLVSILPWAMIKSQKDDNIEIICKQKVTDKLYHQLKNYYIPILSQHISYYNNVKIITQTANKPIESIGAVGTGISGGVDSSYSIAKYISCEDERYKLTHGVYFNMGIYGGLESKSHYMLQKRTEKIAKENSIVYLEFTSNTCIELYGKAYAPIVPFIFMGAILSLQKLFGTYYYSSGYSVLDFELSEIDAAYFDLLNVENFSTDSLNFYSSGIEIERIGKVSYITDFPFTYDNLSVCLNADQEDGNCGRCAKCTRTMTELDALGKLDLYKNSFKLDEYYKAQAYHWGFVLMKSKSDPFCKEIMRIYKASGRKLPLKVYVAALRKWIKRGFTATNRQREKVENFIK